MIIKGLSSIKKSSTKAKVINLWRRELLTVEWKSAINFISRYLVIYLVQIVSAPIRDNDLSDNLCQATKGRGSTARSYNAHYFSNYTDGGPGSKILMKQHTRLTFLDEF